jgi:O-antigen ligase
MPLKSTAIVIDSWFHRVMVTTMSKLFLAWLPIFAICFILAIIVLSHLWLPLIEVASGIGFVLFTIFDPLKGFLAWLLISPWLSSYIQLSLPAGFPDLTLERVAIGSIVMGLLLQVISKTKRLLPIGVIEKVMILFITVGTFSVILRSDNMGGDLLIFFDEYATPFLFFVAAKNLFRSHDDIRKLYYALFLLGLCLALHGIYQYITHATPPMDYRYDFINLEDEQHIIEGRAVGPFLLGQVYGGVLTIIFLWTLHMVLVDSQGLKRFLLVIGLGLMSLGVFLSMTRSIWLSFFVSLFVIQIFNQKLRKIFVLSIAGLSIIFLLTWFTVSETTLFKQRIEGFTQRIGEPNTIYQRLVNYKAALMMSMDKPVFGYGRGKWTFMTARQDYLSSIGSVSAEWGTYAGPPHNQLLYIMVQYGLLGLVPYLVIFFLIIKSGLSSMRLLPDKRSLHYQFVIFFWGTLAAYFVQSQFVDISALTFLSIIFYILAGILEALRSRILLPNETTAGQE